MSSGVGVNDNCLTEFQVIKLGKKYRYVIYKLSADNKEIVVDKTGPIDSTYDSFTAELPEAEPRWVVYDFEYKLDEGGQRNKLTFISWSPDDAKIRPKMLYASSRDALRRRLDGIALEIQGTAFDEVSYEAILDKAKRSAR
ncbi:actin depolymerizing factor [Cantharellus anzutake]|uniref:actin depolymerizing factor n=1 Tax=Cantharellus anzutake TaxID=1750568 RepID=UPI001906544D|nr:actin depolymerizing factor [Cantharellus anzutake]KAF8333421.1 actin depolymerizing factor [Cantharellus anzutake]